jgi:mycofactocin glycosyltransferase
VVRHVRRFGQHSDVAQPINPARGPKFPADGAITIDPEVSATIGPGGRLVVIGGSPWRILRLVPPAPAIWELLAQGQTMTGTAGLSGVRVEVVQSLARRLLEAQMAHPLWRDADPSASILQEPTVDVTVVIPVHNRADSLARLLSSLVAGGITPTQIVVVDDGSTDTSGAVAADYGATVVRNSRPTGPGAARQAGLAVVTTPYVAFVDSDCVVPAKWISRLRQHFHDPTVAVVAPRIGQIAAPATGSAPTGSVPTDPLGAYEAVASSLDLGPRPGLVRARTKVAYVPAAALLCRVNAIREVGGFDPLLHVGEDVDLMWRLDAAGWRVRYEPAVVVAHDHRTALRPFATRRFQYGTSAAVLDQRHHGLVPPVAVNPWSAVAWAAAMVAPPIGLALGAVTAGVSAELLRRRLASSGITASTARTLAWRGHVGAGRLLASSVWRTYLPVVVPLAALPIPVVSAAARRSLLLSAVVPAAMQWRSRRPNLDPVRYLACKLIDDSSYCAGVWTGAFRIRRFGALLPDFSPGRVDRT